MFEHFSDQRDCLYNQNATTVRLFVELRVLCQSEHHLKHQKPNLSLCVQNLVWVVLDQFQKKLYHTFQQLEVWALLADEQLQLDCIDHLLLQREVLAEHGRYQVGARVLEERVDVACLLRDLLLEESQVELVERGAHVEVQLALPLLLFLLEQLFLLVHGDPDVLVEVVELVLEKQNVLGRVDRVVDEVNVAPDCLLVAADVFAEDGTGLGELILSTYGQALFCRIEILFYISFDFCHHRFWLKSARKFQIFIQNSQPVCCILRQRLVHSIINHCLLDAITTDFQKFASIAVLFVQVILHLVREGKVLANLSFKETFYETDSFVRVNTCQIMRKLKNLLLELVEQVSVVGFRVYCRQTTLKHEVCLDDPREPVPHRCCD